MKTEEYDYYLPEHLIAQHPLNERSNSRMMTINRKNNKIEHKTFDDIINLLNEQDILVLNNTKVVSSRLIGMKEKTGAKIEVFFIEEKNNNTFIGLTKPSRRVKTGTKIIIKNIELECIDEYEEGMKLYKYNSNKNIYKLLEEIGEVPTPPYIIEKLEDKNKYQTVYANSFGSVAAPTAGLHFTNDILNKIKNKGIEICYITLHVGMGTFKPVKVDNIEQHKMHKEYYSITQESADILNNAITSNKRIVCVGTTSVRTLESIFSNNKKIIQCSGYTDIFIYPGYKFNVVGALLTNFHLPKSTLLMLVSAFYNKDKILEVYKLAIDKQYRFFSFGDCMFIE